jgi:hypothetical protein
MIGSSTASCRSLVAVCSGDGGLHLGFNWA